MNLIDAASQQFHFNFHGTTITPEVAAFMAETRPGGVVIFARNMTSAKQARQLNRDLQAYAASLGLPPLIISVDEEGGRVSRMPGDLDGAIVPSPMAQAAAGRAEAAAWCAALTARRLRALGFTMDLAPVADVNNNPANPVIGTRSYGGDPQQVGQCVAAAVAAYSQHGIAACAKHFPGHGDTSVDSHLGLPELDRSPEQLAAVEFVPFEAAIAAGLPAMMTAHIVFPQLDPSGYPATLSPIILRGLLREQLGFEGLIFTDALDMKAISANYGVPQAARLALQAGACLMAPVGNLERQLECYRGLIAAAEAGEFDVHGEAARVARHKAQWVTPFVAALNSDPTPEQWAQEIAEWAQSAAEVGRQSITVVGDVMLPITALRPLVVDFTLAAGAAAEQPRQPARVLEAALRPRLPGLTYMKVSADPSTEEIEQTLNAANNADAIVVLMRNAASIDMQRRVATRLLGLVTPAIAVAARDPYDLAAVRAFPRGIATYGDPPATMRALAGALLGDFVPGGRLPVALI